MKQLAKRTILVAAVLLVLAIVAGTAAYGYFFNGKEIENNQIKTGNITLQLNGGGVVAPIDLNNGVNDIMPGEYGTEGGWTIENIGTTNASLFIQLTPDEWDSNLADVLISSFWLDRDQDGIWSDGDSYFKPDGTYVSFAAGDTGAVPAAAFQNMSRWTSALINTMNVEVGVLGNLQFSWLLPADVHSTVDSGPNQGASLMGKSCNFDLLVQLDQYHKPTHVLGGATSGHSPLTVSMYNGGFLVNSTTVTGSTYSITVPAIDGYTAVFTWPGGQWVKPGIIDMRYNDILNADCA